MEDQLNYPAMLEYHQQQVHITSQDEEIDRAVREKARQLTEETDVAEDKETALEGCVTNHAGPSGVTHQRHSTRQRF